MITQEFDLNLIPNQAPVVVHVDQYDHGEGRLVANLYNGDTAYAPDGTVVIQGTKPDGHGFAYSATLEGNVVTADLTEQMAAVAGDVRTQIVVTESTGRTGTFAFTLKVQKSALPDDTDMSESDYATIERAVERAEDAVQSAQAATAQSSFFRLQSEAWAKGTKNGTPVPSTDETYHNNSKYWAEKSQEYAVGALHFKASVAFANIPIMGMVVGDMYNITDAFTTDSRFEEGAGIAVPAGANIAWSPNDKWDLLAVSNIGGGVTSFNGRTGAVSPATNDYSALMVSYTGIGPTSLVNVKNALDEGAGYWSNTKACLVGDTSATFAPGILDIANYTITPYSQTASGKPVGFSQITVSGTSVTVTFSSALTEAADIKLHITK